MKKFLITAYDTMGNHSVLQLVKSKNKETVMSYMYNKYIKDKNYWEISSENFRSYYEHIGTRLNTLPYSYAYTKRKNNIEVYDGTTTFFYKFFEIKNEIDNYAVILETDILKPNIVSRTVYYKILNEIDNLRILYNCVTLEEEDVFYDNEFDWLLNYESAFFSNELLDYNDFDYDTGEVKEVNIIGGTTNNESSLVICKINFEDIILL
tara:strand:+ start:127 stop:750 length:624 start_codon:yes stop_codon:yes gene_type:complete